MNNLNTSYIGLRSDVIDLIKGESLEVLDIGCATGATGAQFLSSKLAKQVDGIEFNPDMASIARASLSAVYQGDLNSENFLSDIEAKLEQYDYILFGDVLEHLLHPGQVLLFFEKYLKPKGKIIISLPNMVIDHRDRRSL